jgi:ectoine hydroxylase-related dioxygenase (phytanoyl-CoA dioxygenase family)
MLTSEQIRAFDENGYLRLPKLISDAEAAWLRTAADGLVAALPALADDWPEDFHHGGLFGDAIGVGESLCRIEYTFDKHPQFLLLLGNPQILQIPLSLHDGPFLVTWEDMVIKSPGSGNTVPMHQDALFQCVNSQVFSVGVYLDSSDEDPLLVLPGTHRFGPLGEDQIKDIAEERRHQVIPVPVNAGDAIVHNVRMIHGSGANNGHAARRVLYLEFRTAEQVLHDSPWDASWLGRRLPYIPLAIALRASSAPALEDDPMLLAELAERRPEWFSGSAEASKDVDLRVHHHDLAAQA